MRNINGFNNKLKMVSIDESVTQDIKDKDKNKAYYTTYISTLLKIHKKPAKMGLTIGCLVC